MSAMASQITSLTIVYPTVYSAADQRKHQCSASLAFVRGIHRWPVNSPHQGPVTRKMFPFDDVIMEFHPRTIFLIFYKINIIIVSHVGLGFSSYPQLHWLFKSLFKLSTQKTLHRRITVHLQVENMGGFPSQRVSNAKSFAIPWCNHGNFFTMLLFGKNVTESPRNRCDERYIDGFAQDCRKFSALAMELLQSCAKPPMCELYILHQ